MRNIDENKIVIALDFLDELQIPEPKTVEFWCEKLNSLMMAENHAAVAIFGYSLPYPSNMLGCPLGDEEFKKYGALISCDSEAFAAAEKTGLIAKGIDAIFFDALNNCGSWSYHFENVKYILETEELSKYVSFDDRYVAEHLISGGKILCEDDALWFSYVTAIDKKLCERSSRGY